MNASDQMVRDGYREAMSDRPRVIYYHPSRAVCLLSNGSWVTQLELAQMQNQGLITKRQAKELIPA